jgi:hypothetical protein
MSTGAPKRCANQATDQPVKRTRVSRACDQCRLAREKCNGLQPTCSTCSKSRRACTYTANVKKRGIQPGYIRALELALAYLFQHDPENETLVHEKLAQNRSASLLLSRDSKESNKLHRRWRKTRFYTDVDKLLSGGEPSRHEQSEPLSSDSDEEDTTEDQSASVTIAIGNPTQAHTQPAPFQAPRHLPLTHLQPPAGLDARTSLPSESWRLLEVYFSYSQAWLPICSKQDVLRTLYSYPPEGIALTLKSPDSGHHAELFSILAVAIMHDTASSTSVKQQYVPHTTLAELYAVARSLIPEELDHIDLGHVKALLNLSLVALDQTSPQAAWLLVGLASRVLQVMELSSLISNSTHKNVLHGCYIIDSLLAIHLGQRPYLRVDEARKFGRIDEDGLDEWQPWNCGFGSGQQPRAPTMALSSFNVILDLILLLGDNSQSAADALMRLESWETALPHKLAFVRSLSAAKNLNPATTLLRMAYHCTRLLVTQSEPWLLRSLELLECAETEIGWKQLPPVLPCLFGVIQKRSAGISLSQNVQDRLVRVLATIHRAWPKMEIGTASRTDANTTSRPMSTGKSLLQPVPGRDMATEPLPLGPDSVSADMQLVDPPTGHIDPMLDLALPNQTPMQYQQMPSDLESFFDELASLDTANNPDTQPQFLQNLGFAPGANMADLFSEYIPLSTAFMSNDSNDAVNLDHYGFYDGS